VYEQLVNFSIIHVNHVRSSYPLASRLDFALIVSKMRNVTTYISHIYTPNTFVQFDQNDLMLPHIMMFARLESHWRDVLHCKQHKVREHKMVVIT